MVIVAILGTVGVLLPVVSIARGERGSNPFYGIIALGALGASMAFVGYRLVTDSVHPATLFSQEVLSDDHVWCIFCHCHADSCGNDHCGIIQLYAKRASTILCRHYE